MDNRASRDCTLGANFSSAGGARIKIRKFLRLGVNTKGRRAEESSPSLQDFSNVYIATGTVLSFDRAIFSI